MKTYQETPAILSNARRSTFEGRDVVIASVTILVEGVHRGSAGPLYYPAQTLQASAQFWNGVPLPVYHPEQNGSSISCNTPEVTEARSIGRLYNVQYKTSPARLEGEAWIEVEKANAIAPEILARLDNGETIEVSTGLFSTDEHTAGTWNNESYQAVVKDMRPDHLAILPGTTGACSIADGCGLRANEEGGEMRRRVDNDDDLLDIHREKAHSIIDNEMSLDEKRQKVARAIYVMDGPTQDNMIEEVYNDYVVYTVRPGPQSIPSGTIPKMYKRNYSISENGEVTLGDEIQEVRKETNYVPVANTETKTNEKKEEKKMIDKARVDALIANGTFTEEDREFLTNCECAQFTRIETIANKPPEKVVENAKPQTWDEIVANAPQTVKDDLAFAKATREAHRAGVVNRIKANQNNKLTDEQLAAMDIQVLEAMADSFTPPVSYEGLIGVRTVVNQDFKQNGLCLPGMEPKE